VGGVGHVGGSCEAPYDTRESGSDGARALQVGGIVFVCGGCNQIRAQEAGLWRAITFQGFGMARGKWVDSAQDSTVLGGRAGCRTRVPVLKSRPSHAFLSLTGAKDPLLWSGRESDPHVSKPTFHIERKKAFLRDLNRPSSRSKATFGSGQAKSGPKRLGFGGP
jgi:hypothetical protein